jgi:hypothetical protein
MRSSLPDWLVLSFMMLSMATLVALAVELTE